MGEGGFCPGERWNRSRGQVWYNSPGMIGAAQISDEVVRTAAEGDAAARATLLEAIEPRVRLMVAARLSPRPEQFGAVDDITQDVLLAVMAGVGRLRARTAGALRGFTSSTTTHKVVDYLRDKGSARATNGRAAIVALETTINRLSGAVPLWELLSGSSTSPSAACERAELAARLLEELGRLPAHYRDVITLAFFDGLSTAEIAANQGSTRHAAAMLLLRAVRELRRSMTGSSRCERVDD